MNVRAGAAIITALVACGGDGSLTDAGGDAAPSDAGVADTGALPTPAPPRDVAPPAIAPCPTGWAEVVLRDGLSYCEPWPSDEPACPDGTHRFPGDSACAPLGPPCAADGWPADVAPAPTTFVRAGASPGGDGTRALPFATIGEALATASPGSVVAVAVGAYDEAVVIPEHVTVRGACVSGTTLTTTAAASAIVRSEAAGAVLENATVGPGFTGIRAEGVGHIVVRNVHVDGSNAFGLVGFRGGTVEGESVVVSNVQPTSAGDLGMGAIVDEGGHLRITRGSVEGCSTAAVLVRAPESTVELVDTVLRETLPSTTGGLGIGIAAQEEARVTLTRSVVERVRSAGVWSSDAAVVELDSSLVRGISIVPDEQGGNAVMAYAGGTLRAQRTAIADAELSLFVAVGYRTIVEASDILCFQPAGVVSDAVGPRLGVAVQGAGTLDIERLAVSGTYGVAVGVSDLESTLRVRDMTVIGTRAAGTFFVGGRAVHCDAGGTCTIDGLLAVDNVEAAVLSSGEGTVTRLTDATIRATNSNPWDGTTGRAISAQLGSTIEVTRAVFEGNREVSVLAATPGTIVRLTDVVIRSTSPRACSETTCAGYGAGSGVSAISGARIEIASFLVTESALAGLQIAGTSTMTARDGVVSRNLVGLNNQNPMLDLGQLMENVYFVDNVQNLDATALPVPDGEL